MKLCSPYSHPISSSPPPPPSSSSSSSPSSPYPHPISSSPPPPSSHWPNMLLSLLLIIYFKLPPCLQPSLKFTSLPSSSSSVYIIKSIISIIPKVQILLKFLSFSSLYSPRSHDPLPISPLFLILPRDKGY